MHQNRASLGDGFVDEIARGREVDKEIREVTVFDWDSQLSDPASGNISRNRIRTDRNDMGDLPLRYGSGSASGNQTIKGTDETR